MPNKNIRLQAWSFYWVEPDWILDGGGGTDIALAVVEEPYAGTITRKELDYDAVRVPFPVQ